METITAVKNDAKKLRRTIINKTKKAAVVTAVGAGAVALTYFAAKTAIKAEFDERIGKDTPLVLFKEVKETTEPTE